MATLRESPSRSEVTIAVRRATQAVLTALAAAVREARQRARQVAAEQSAAEVAAMTQMGAEVAPGVVEDHSQTDAAHADAAAASYASAWSALALAALSVWASKGGKGSPAAAIQTTISRSDYRIVRTVVTETARAHSDEHRSRVIGLKKTNTGRPWLGRAFRRWDARLDRVVCSVCRAHESEETPIGKPFRMGHEPGDVHPGCRCIATLIMLPLDREDVVGVNATTNATYVESGYAA
jgi:hypothetical protein